MELNPSKEHLKINKNTKPGTVQTCATHVNNHREQSQAPRPTDCEKALSQDVTHHTRLSHPPEWLKLDLEAGGVMEAPVGGHANVKAIGIPL